MNVQTDNALISQGSPAFFEDTLHQDLDQSLNLLTSILPNSEDTSKQQDAKPAPGTASQQTPQAEALMKVIDLRQTFGLKTELISDGEAQSFEYAFT